MLTDDDCREIRRMIDAAFTAEGAQFFLVDREMKQALSMLVQTVERPAATTGERFDHVDGRCDGVQREVREGFGELRQAIEDS